MSRVGLKPIPIPGAVSIDLAEGGITVKGPKGTIAGHIAKTLTLEQADGIATVGRPSNDRFHRSQHGLARTLIDNMIKGVTDGHAKSLEIHGVGYRAQLAGRTLQLTLGYSHPVNITAPDGIEFEVKTDEKTRVTAIVVKGIDKALVGQIAADIRKTRKPDPYKGKGVRYLGEVVKLRPGKRAGK